MSEATGPYWQGRRVLITGGCSFIGSHLAEALVSRGAVVRIADNLSSGSRDNIRPLLDANSVDFIECDLLDGGAAEAAVDGMQNVFHLAADHGGRGYIELHEANCASNLALDGLMIRAAHQAGVDHFTFASSGCVYPTDLQANPEEEVFLTEDLVRQPYRPDGMYGWAKLMAELSLKAYHEDFGLKCASLRYFTVYGERCTESHAVIAMIARAFVGQDPYVIWGTGEQIRNWTHVSDIVEGTIRAAERINDGTAVNLGTMERIRVIDAARSTLEQLNRSPELRPDPAKPTGPYNRVADNSLARRLLDWEPRVMFADGLSRTIRWYVDNHDPESVAQRLEYKLTERLAPQQPAA